MDRTFDYFSCADLLGISYVQPFPHPRKSNKPHLNCKVNENIPPPNSKIIHPQPPNTLEKNSRIHTCLLAKPATYTCIYLDFSMY